MKKMKTTLAMGMIFLATTSFGQSNDQVSGKIKNDKTIARTYFDVMVNMASTNFNREISGSDFTDYSKSSRGIQGGISFQGSITKSFSVVSELYYMRKGGTMKSGKTLYGVESKVRLNTVELPVLARVHFGKFYVNAGAAAAYNISGIAKSGEGSSKLQFGNSVNEFKRFEAGAQVGAGMIFPTKKYRVNVDVRYTQGLTDITNGHDIQNRALMVSLRISKLWRGNPFANKSNQETGK